MFYICKADMLCHLEVFGYQVHLRVGWLACSRLEGMHLVKVCPQEVHDAQSRVLKHCEDLHAAHLLSQDIARPLLWGTQQ